MRYLVKILNRFVQSERSSWGGGVREEHLVSLIATALNKYDRVLVIYGNGHLVEARPVLLKTLGSPVDKNFF